jgi:hypothetical protein
MPRQREVVNLPFAATTKQSPFVKSSAMFKLGGGARGGGKSHCLAGIGVLLSFMYPGNSGYCGRAQLTDFERTTLPLLLNSSPRNSSSPTTARSTSSTSSAATARRRAASGMGK